MSDIQFIPLTVQDRRKIIEALELLDAATFGEREDLSPLIEKLRPLAGIDATFEFNLAQSDALNHDQILVIAPVDFKTLEARLIDNLDMSGWQGAEGGRITRPGGGGFSDFFSDDKGFTE